MNNQLFSVLVALAGLPGMMCPATAHAFAALNELNIYERPSEDSVVRGKLGAGDDDICLDPGKQKSAPPGWVAIASRKSLVPKAGWVRREALAAPLTSGA